MAREGQQLLATYKYHELVVCSKQGSSTNKVRAANKVRAPNKQPPPSGHEDDVLQHLVGDRLVALHREVDVLDAAAPGRPPGQRIGRQRDGGEDVVRVAVVGDPREQRYAA